MIRTAVLLSIPSTQTCPSVHPFNTNLSFCPSLQHKLVFLSIPSTQTCPSVHPFNTNLKAGRAGSWRENRCRKRVPEQPELAWFSHHHSDLYWTKLTRRRPTFLANELALVVNSVSFQAQSHRHMKLTQNAHSEKLASNSTGQSHVTSHCKRFGNSKIIYTLFKSRLWHLYVIVCF